MDKLTKRQRSRLMSKIKSKKTKPETAIHNLLKDNKILHKMNPKMEGNPDVLIEEMKIVIFVNGCFWHKCEKHFRLPKTNVKFWREKMDRNVERQGESIKSLKKLGYHPMTIWEHDLR